MSQPTAPLFRPRARRFALVCVGIGALLAPLVSVADTPSAVASAPSVIDVSGGTITDHDGFRYHLFTHTGSVGGSTDYSLEISEANITADVLVVAGGGGGGRNRAGGGGAGGLIITENMTLNAGEISITVGGGGPGGAPDPVNFNNSASRGCQGIDSTFGDTTADGGGGGGASGASGTWILCDGSEDNSTLGLAGGDGGSGGGGAYPASTGGTGGKGGSGTDGQGNDGGDGSDINAGGGGGAGGAGVTAATGVNGDGGIGFTSDVATAMGIATATGEQSGNSVYFAGGGGGFRNGAAGLGGGGRHGLNGLASTGGGGGACNSTSCSGGSPGGSGVVIVRYAVPAFQALSDPHSPSAEITQTIAFGAQLPALGLRGAHSVEVIDGSLPTGISLDGLTGEEVRFSGEADEVGIFTFTLRAYQTNPDDGATRVTDRAVSVSVPPEPPTGVQVFDQDGKTMISVTPPTEPGSEAVTYQASIDAGENWVDLVASGGDWEYPEFDRSRQQSVSVRAINEAGASSSATPVAFPQFMLNNSNFRVGGGGHNGSSFTKVSSIGANGVINQPFYFDNVANRWAKMTHGTAPFDFALGFGTGNQPSTDRPYDPSKNWTGATVYGTFQNPNPFQTPLEGSSSVTAENFSCVFEPGESVCMGTGTLVASADFELGGRTVRVVNHYTLAPGSKFLEVVTTVENPDGSALENVNVWVGTADEYLGLSTEGGDGTNSADFPTKTRGTIDTAGGTFQPLGTSADRATALFIESTDGRGLFFSTSANTNVTIAPCCESFETLAAATSASRGTNTGSGFENAVILDPTSSAISTPLDASFFKPTNPEADFFQNRRTDLRDAGYALHLPLGSITPEGSQSATWFLGGVPLAQEGDLLNAVVQARANEGRGTLTVDLSAAPAPTGTIGYEIRLRQSGVIIDTVRVFGQVAEYTFADVIDGRAYQVDVAPLAGSEQNPSVGNRTLFSDPVTPLPPLNTALPTIIGTVFPGATLEFSVGDWEWEGAELATTLQWQRNGADIPGATESTYTVPVDVNTGEYTIVVTRQVAGGTAVVATSNPVDFDPDTNLIVAEDFSGPLSNQWVLTGSAQVTSGSLQLTPAEDRKAGAAFYNVAQQTDGGIDATFVINQREGTGADGMTFFLKNGDNTSTVPGAAGSRLGFGAVGSIPGISDALIGVGFDRFGGFIRASNRLQAGGFTCPDLGGFENQGENTGQPNNLTLRGPGNGLDGYCKLAEGVYDSGTVWQDTERTIRVRYDLTASPESNQIRIWVDDVADTDSPVISAAAPQELRDAETFKFGFTAATGSRTNIHEVKSLRVEAATQLAVLQPIVAPAVPAAVAGEPFEFDLSNLLRGGVRPFAFSVGQGALPPGLTINSPLAGTPNEPGLYEFTIEGRDSRPGALQSFVSLDVAVQVNASQTISFPTLAPQQLRLTPLTANASTTLDSAASPPGLPPTYTTATGTVCEVTSSGSITLLSRGECKIVSSQGGGSRDGFDILAATPVEQSFTVYDAALASLSLSDGVLSPSFSPTTTSYQVTVPDSVTSVSLTPTTRYVGAGVSVSGVPTPSGSASQAIALQTGENPVSLTITDGVFSNTISLTITRSAAPPVTPVTPVAPTTPTPTPTTSPSVTTPSAQPPRPSVSSPVADNLTIVQPPTTSGPLALSPQPSQNPAPTPTAPTTPQPPLATSPALTNGQAPSPSAEPGVLVGGAPVSVQQTTTGTSGIRLLAGSLTLGVGVASPSHGFVSPNSSGTPELQVVKGQPTVISGSGVAPGSTIQVFLPLQGSNAIELGQLQADANGSFEGTAVLNTAPGQAPLPIGRQVLQILGVDADGNQTVVNMTITVAQPEPQPEMNRENLQIPTLARGQSLATEAGIPVPVTVTAIPENNETLIEGDGWTMGISASRANAQASEEADGGVVLTLVRDDTATVSGKGFMPLTRADVWLFSEPVLLGTVDIDENGEFNGVVNVDGAVVTVGEHTLQLQGVGGDGYVRSANLGVVVTDASSSAAQGAGSRNTAVILGGIGVAGVLAGLGGWWWLRRRASV